MVFSIVLGRHVAKTIYIYSLATFLAATVICDEYDSYKEYDK